MRIRPILPVAAVAAATSICAFAAQPVPVQDAAAVAGCENDRLDDLAVEQGRKIAPSKVFLVPLPMQEQAQRLLGPARVRVLDGKEMHGLLGADARIDAVPYLVRACFVSVSALGNDADLMNRAFEAAALDPVYYPYEKVLVASTFGLASRRTHAHPVALVIDSDMPIEEVRISASGAE